jgi:hypothetical protein
MRENSFLGQYTLKSQEIRKWRGIMMENSKYGWECYDGSLRDIPIENPFPNNTISTAQFQLPRQSREKVIMSKHIS